MTYVVEKGVPIPETQKAHPSYGTRGRGRKAVYPFAEMEVGDSFVAEIELGQYTPKASFAANVYGRSRGLKFVCRKIDYKSARIWRVA